MYLWHSVFKLNWTFILTGCCEYLYISVWYEASFTQIKQYNAYEVTESSFGDVVHVFMSSNRYIVK